MAEENKKININSFFERTEEVGGMAGKALQNSELNASAIQANKTLINSLSVTIEAMKTEIRDIANYIVIENKLEKDKKEDEKFEAEDAKQKKDIKDQILAAGKQGPKGDKGDPAPKGETKSSGGNFIGGLIKALVVGGTAIAAAKFLAPVLIPMVLKVGVPLIGNLVGNLTGFAIGGFATKLALGLSALGGISILGVKLGFFNKLAEGVTKNYESLSKSISEKVKSIFTPKAGEEGKSSGSNLSLSAGGEGGIAGDLKLDDPNIKDKQEKKQEEKEVRTKKKGKVTPKPAMEVGKFKPAPPEKPKGFKRFLAGAGDFITGGRFDLDKRGSSVTDKLNVPATIMNAVAPPKPDTSAIAPANTPNTSQAIIRPTSPTIPFIKTVKNQYLSTNPNTNKLPPEIARMIQ